MKSQIASAVLITICFYTPSVAAQAPSLEDFDQLMNIAESLFETEFSPPVSSQAFEEAGSTWFVRDYCYLASCVGSGAVMAVNVSGGPGFTQGGVYGLGGPLGNDVMEFGNLEDLLEQAISIADGDGNGESRILNDGNGNCVDFVIPAAGTIVDSRISTLEFDDDGQPTGLFTNFENSKQYISSSNTQVTVRSEQTANVAGGDQTIIIETTDTWQIMNELRYLTRVDSTIDTTLSIQGIQQQQLSTVVTTYEDPGNFEGPAFEICDEAEWFSAETVSTATTTFQTSLPSSMLDEETVISDTPAVTTVVNSVDTDITVEAGTFTTALLTSTEEFGRTVHWIDIETGVLVKSETYDADDSLVGANEVIQLTN